MGVPFKVANVPAWGSWSIKNSLGGLENSANASYFKKFQLSIDTLYVSLIYSGIALYSWMPMWRSIFCLLVLKSCHFLLTVIHVQSTFFYVKHIAIDSNVVKSTAHWSLQDKDKLSKVIFLEKTHWKMAYPSLFYLICSKFTYDHHLSCSPSLVDD